MLKKVRPFWDIVFDDQLYNSVLESAAILGLYRDRLILWLFTGHCVAF